MKQRSKWFWLWTAVGAAGLLIALALAGIFLWAFLQLRDFRTQTDTGDLRARTEAFAESYLETRTNGALVIAVIQKGKVNWLGRGRISEANTNAPDLNTVFETGSVTKVFTGLALARMVQDGKVDLHSTLRSNLPPGIALAKPLEPITLLQLATHTAGFPRLPSNFDVFAADPYADYTTTNLYNYLASAELDRAPGKSSAYSNLGVALLGHLLELRTGESYEQLLRESILEPLQMTNTAASLTEQQQTRFASGHHKAGNVVPAWNFSVLAPAGALRSSAGDLVRFLQANLNPAEHPDMKVALELAQTTHFSSWLGEVGLCWQILDVKGVYRFHWHNGGTAGSVSFIGFDRQHQTGVVLLSSYGDAMAGDSSLDEIGMKLLKLAAKISWEQPPSLR